MRNIFKTMATLAGSSRGATAVEYGLIAALVVVAAIGGMKNLAGGSGSLWARISTSAGNVL